MLPALWPEADMLGRWTGEWEELPHVAGDLARHAAWRPGRIRRVFPSLDLERGFDANSYLFDLVIQGATQRYGEITEPIKQRINREFEEARAQNMAPYLLLYHQIARALEERGISRGVGRGRLVASVLAYSLGISRIDPLQYNLVAKSLLGEGETVPPVLVEIPRGGVGPLLEWLRESFGEERLAEIGRVQETRRDQMINELATWAGMTDEERRLAHREKARLRSAGAAGRLGELAEGKRSRRWRDAAFVGDLAARLAPRPRCWQGTGDRYVLCGEPLEAIVPLVRSSQDRPVTMLEEAAIDRLGLARLAFVPHGLLDILDQAMQAARAQRPGLDFTNIPLDDRATYELLARGDTAGIPPLEGIAMRSLLRRSVPRNLLQLLRVKTEAGAGHEGAAARDLASELPDVLLSYQCAYIKANFPLAFYGAAISAVVGARGNPVALIREARRSNFEIKPPDINLSDWDTTIQSGAIRLGLATIKGFGRRAWEHVKNVRSGGSFESLEAFCERVDTRLINLRMLRMLIAAGAMDRLARNRATMDVVIAQLQKNARELEEIQGGSGQATLFDMDPREDEDAPSLAPFRMPDMEEWNDWDKVQREREALGFYLSMDPIHRFRIVLGHLRPLHMEEVSPRLAGRSVRLVGLVTAVEREGPLAGDGQWVVADLEGLPVLLTPHMAEVSADCLEPATEALVIGRMERDGVGVRMIADGIWRLADLEDQATRVARLRLRLTGENKATLKLLLALAKEFPGAAELELADYPGRHGWTWGRLARQRVFFCSPLYQRLCRILPPDAIELFGQADEPLAIQLPAAADKPPTPPADAEDAPPQSDSPEVGDGAEMAETTEAPEAPEADEPTDEPTAPSEAAPAGETTNAAPANETIDAATQASGATPPPSSPADPSLLA
jgi:DNA polymerase III alpha subunit